MRRYRVLSVSFLAAALAAACVPPARAEVLVNIDKTTQSMTVTVDGAPRYIWPVSTGRAGRDTPNGVFRPFRMEADHFSKEWDDAPMPHSIFFTKVGHAIHGYLDTRNIGTAASHGCVRLSAQNAATLYELVEAEGLKDTTVVISGATPPPSSATVARARAPVPAAAPATAQRRLLQPPVRTAAQQSEPNVQDAPAPQHASIFGGPDPPPLSQPGEQRTSFFGGPSQSFFGGPLPPQPPPPLSLQPEEHTQSIAAPAAQAARPAQPSPGRPQVVYYALPQGYYAQGQRAYYYAPQLDYYNGQPVYVLRPYNPN